MIIIAETRYGGIYEGGRWAAFGLPDEAFGLAGERDLPPEAFGGDNQACAWWAEPTIEVEVGDTPDEASERLGLLRSYAWTRGLFVVGDAVELAGCVPDDWYGPGPGVVMSVDELASGPGESHRIRQWIYSVRFADSIERTVPQRYVRSVPRPG